MNLEPIDPETALELYLADKENELAASSLAAHKYRLQHFVRWCCEQDIENLNTLTGRQLHKYRLWRRKEGDLSTASEKTQMDTIRVFIRWLESIDGVQQDLSQKVQSPSLSADENTRDVMLETEDANRTLKHLEKFQYASRLHVVVTLLWRTMMRTGAIYALDVEDYNPDDQFLEVRHRPETGTPIKNKSDGERLVALSDGICALLDDWIAGQRPDVTDEYGRKPLITTNQGRIGKSTIREYCYRATQPCLSGECPHDRNPTDCDATNHGNTAQCPSSVSPHAVRRGSITHWLNNEMPYKAVGGRANVSHEILEQHYDRRSEREKMEQRRQYLDNI